MNLKLIDMGDFMGNSRFFGKCWDCGTQFMSTHERVLPIGHGDCVCVNCANTREKNLDKEYIQHMQAKGEV